MILLRNRICGRKLSAIGVLGEARQANRVTRHNGVNLVYNVRRPYRRHRPGEIIDTKGCKTRLCALP